MTKIIKKNIQIYRRLSYRHRKVSIYNFMLSFFYQYRLNGDIIPIIKKNLICRSPCLNWNYITMQLTVKSNYNITDFNYNKYGYIFVHNNVIVINLPPHFYSQLNESEKYKILQFDLQNQNWVIVKSQVSCLINTFNALPK